MRISIDGRNQVSISDSELAICIFRVLRSSGGIVNLSSLLILRESLLGNDAILPYSCPSDGEGGDRGGRYKEVARNLRFADYPATQPHN